MKESKPELPFKKAKKKKQEGKKYSQSNAKKTPKKDTHGDISLEKDDTTLKLEDVLGLGGKKKDFKLLQDINDDDSEISCADGDGDEAFKNEDIKEFMEKVGLMKSKDEGKIIDTNYQNESSSIKTKDDSIKSKKKTSTKKKFKDVQIDTTETDGLMKSKNEGGISNSQKEIGSIKSKNGSIKSKKKSSTKNKFKDVQIDTITSTTSESYNFDVLKNLSEKHTSRKLMLFKSGPGKWYDFKDDNSKAETPSIDSNIVENVCLFAKRIYDEELALFREQQDKKKGSDINWIRKVISSGTLSDRVSALTVIIQDSPIHSLANLESLIGMTRKKGRREAMMALDSLTELFVNDMLTEKKLLTFSQHSFPYLLSFGNGEKDCRDKILYLWYFEDKMKKCYNDFLIAVQNMLQDTILIVKKKALKCVYELLVKKPEQEKLLLSLLVNKLGDPDKKLAAQTVHFLNKLVEEHPNMKAIVVTQVESLLYRSNVAPKAQYYSVCFLHQLILCKGDQELAMKLVKLYFSFFKSYVKNKNLDSKMMAGLLSGVNRAYPYAKMDRTQIEEQLTLLHKCMQMLNFNTSVLAFSLMYQVMDPADSSCDRYYSSLYKKILDPELLHTSKKAIFLNLIFKSMKKDICLSRIKAFIKRLLQVCSYSSPPFICASLIVVSEMVKEKPDLLNFSIIPDDDLSDEEEHFTDVKIQEDGTASLVKSQDEILQTKSETNQSSWLHRNNVYSKKKTTYDPFARNPSYCSADKDSTWEIEHLTCHFHPTVKLFAESLLKGEAISYSSDPLEDFTLSRFLDRFVYKNPKIKEPSNNVRSVFKGKSNTSSKGARSFAVNTKEFFLEGEENIPVDEKFFFKYFSQINQKLAAKLPNEYDSDASDVTDDEFDDYLENFEKGLVGEAAAEIDFAREMSKSKNIKPSKKKGDMDSTSPDNSDVDLSDEEVDFENDDEFSAAFADFDMDASESNEEDLNDDDDDFIDQDEKQQKFNMVGFDDDDDESDLSDNDDCNELESLGMDRNCSKRKAKLSLPSLGHKKHKKDNMSLFAAAEEFSHLLDQDMNEDTTSAFAVINNDRASAKQLKWEKSREIDAHSGKMLKKHKYKPSSQQKDTKKSGKSINSKKKKMKQSSKRS